MLVRRKVRKVVLVRAGKGYPLVPMGWRTLKVPLATAVVSGRDTAVGNIDGNDQFLGFLGPRVSCPPTVLNMQSIQDGRKRPKRKRWNEDITTLRREGETHLADKVARATHSKVQGIRVG